MVSSGVEAAMAEQQAASSSAWSPNGGSGDLVGVVEVEARW